MIALFGRLSVAAVSLLAALAVSSKQASAQSTTEIREENGNLYRVTTQEIPRSVSKTELREQQQTVYRERYDTQWQTNYRTYLTPVTEYRQELYLANRWNPLATPYWTYRYVPVTRWEARQEPYNVPIAQRTWVPEQQTVRIPQITTQIVTDQVVRKEFIGPATKGGTVGTAPQTSVAVGGLKKFE